MSGANVRRLRGGIEVQWQLPFIFRVLAVNKYDRAHLSWQSSDKELYGCHCTDSGPYGQFKSEKELVLRLRPGRERETERGRKRGQSCGGHILQRHIYYFTTALGKEAALGQCWTHGTDDNHWGNSVNIGEWASNVQGETRTFFTCSYSYTPPCVPYKACKYVK